MKNKIPSALLVVIAIVCSVNAQTTITGTLLGYDNKPLAKCVVLMTVGGPEEKTITIQPDEQGRFRYETNFKGLHFLNFVGVNHQQQAVALHIDKPRELKLNIRLGPEYYTPDVSQAELRGPNAKSSFNGTRLAKQPDGKYATEFLSKDSLIQYHVEQSPFSDDGSPDAQLTQIFQEVNDRKKFVTANKIALTQLSTKILKEKNTLLREALWIKYLNMLFPNPEFNVTTPAHLIDAKMISQEKLFHD